MNLELKNVKYAEFASDDSNCFSATLYLDGRALCTAMNEGHGGPDNIHPVKGRTQEEINALDTALQAMDKPPPDDAEDWLKKLWANGIRSGIEEKIGELLIAHLNERANKQRLKRLLRTKTVFFTKDGSVKVMKTEYSQKVAQFLKKKEPETVILNTLSFDEALTIFTRYLAFVSAVGGRP